MRSKALLLTATVHLAVMASSSPSRAQGADDSVAHASAEASMVDVHVQSRKGVVLLQQRTTGAAWETACVAPCDMRLPTAYRYRAGGGGLSWSSSFALDASPGTHVTLVVERAGQTAFTLGIFGLAFGPVANLVGIGILLGSLDGDRHNPSTPIAGLALAAGGSVIFAAGLVLTIANTRSYADVSQEVEPSPASRLTPGTSPWTPVWSTATTEPKGPQPALGIPIVGVRF